MSAPKDLLKRLGIHHPLIVAPMAGGPSSVELVAESSRAGALGSVGAAYFTPPAIREFVDRVRAQTSRPIAINLFVPHATPPLPPSWIQTAIQATRKYREELDLPEPSLTPPYEEDFEAQFDLTLELRPAALSFVFGKLSADQMRAAQDFGIALIGTATSFSEAEALEATGVDAITLQGFEAGGHRGIFDVFAPDPNVQTLELVAQCRGKIKVPLIAAGGIMNRDQIRQALNMGAQAVQMGTAFLNCKEAGTSAPYRAALLASSTRDTKTTRVFSGRLARGLKNRFMKEMDKLEARNILPFPAQNKFTRDLRAASARKDSADFLSLWCGTGAGELWQGSCRDLIQTLFEN